jgi:hypothetical protein
MSSATNQTAPQFTLEEYKRFLKKKSENAFMFDIPGHVELMYKTMVKLGYRSLEHLQQALDESNRGWAEN